MARYFWYAKCHLTYLLGLFETHRRAFYCVCGVWLFRVLFGLRVLHRKLRSVCFDLSHQGHTESPIIQLNHEDILLERKTVGRKVVADNFLTLLERVGAPNLR